jgi:hypothetical protein
MALKQHDGLPVKKKLVEYARKNGVKVSPRWRKAEIAQAIVRAGKPLPVVKDTRKGRGRGSSKTSPKAIEEALRRARALELRRFGASYQDIADQLGFSGRGAAYNAVILELQRVAREPAEAVLKLELERLDRMLLGIMAKASDPEERGQYGAIDRALKIMDRRARYLGLDAPKQLEVDWRREAAEKGFSPSDIFEKMVEEYMFAMEESEDAEE